MVADIQALSNSVHRRIAEIFVRYGNTTFALDQKVYVVRQISAANEGLCEARKEKINRAAVDLRNAEDMHAFENAVRAIAQAGVAVPCSPYCTCRFVLQP